MSDHFPVSVVLDVAQSLSQPPFKKHGNKNSYQQKKLIDFKLLRELIDNKDWTPIFDSNDVNDAFSKFIHDMMQLRDQAASTRFLHGKFSKKI